MLTSALHSLSRFQSLPGKNEMSVLSAAHGRDVELLKRWMVTDDRSPVIPLSSHFEISGCFPDLVENAGGQGRLVLRKEASIMLLDHIRRILNGIARLLVGTSLL